ncbi:MAG: DUF389 domain-containing protein [Dehalococcoidia bacterium]
MIHLRLVVPEDRSEATLRLLEEAPSVINLVRFPGAARKPTGDVVLCDVAREDATRVITGLRSLRLDKDGTILVEYVDTAISEAAREAERAAPGAVADAVIWETVRARTFEEADLSFTFVAFMALATVIAAMGILTDSLVMIIGAMIVGPEFGPLAGISVAAVERRWSLAMRSVLALGVGFPVGITVAFLLTGLLDFTGVAPETIPVERSETFFISHPDWYSFIVALAAGIAGTLSLTTIKSGALIGVLVSVTTIPAAANIAVAASYGDWQEWRGAQLQLIVNIAAILAAAIGTLLIQRYAYRRWQHPEEWNEPRLSPPSDADLALAAHTPEVL